jgi:hypothetical protein
LWGGGGGKRSWNSGLFFLYIKKIGFIFAFIFILFFAETFYYCSSDDLLLTLFVSLPPVKTYSNAEADKAKILQENQNFAAGIYCFTNLINGKQYVGSGKDLSKRLAFYFSEAQMNYVLKRSQSKIYSAILKHGLANFSLSILEYCEVEMCREREGYFIKSLAPEYNIIQDPTVPPMTGRQHSAESLEKMSA